MIRLLKLQPVAVGAAMAAVYAAAVMLYRAYVAHDAVLDWDLLVVAGMAVWGLYTRSLVTPVEDPRDNDGRALVPAGPTEKTSH